MLLPTPYCRLLNSCRPGYLHKCFIISHQCTILARSHREMANSCQLTFKPYLIRLQGEVRTRNSRLSARDSPIENNSVCKKKRKQHTTSCHWVGAWVCASINCCDNVNMRSSSYRKDDRWPLHEPMHFNPHRRGAAWTSQGRGKKANRQKQCQALCPVS